MTKKNIHPQQVAPVERETISTAKNQSGQFTALRYSPCGTTGGFSGKMDPFAGDDAE
ncbi:MAG: anacyclamide/piricyclamide family prenylated cyclic peptide [Dolichospermum sp. BR01]|nr:anacyclamide/piricyclamide family prenylated cyclic peptide [Dolichospermum sp. BR01]